MSRSKNTNIKYYVILISTDIVVKKLKKLMPHTKAISAFVIFKQADILLLLLLLYFTLKT